ncbi:serine protease [Bacteriovorax sp. DB6_IX]|uniref:S1 family peptidase n=1 Tax=Bacteriovorax sp. DB6_IX TaxID=1353530 RepID=UPI00038A0806|nr:serine protease [Bacteriovorax sp. DB6_IX]EQC51969.1 trypsin-like peptidase domain protein [Bacteriovorax sp. DB6_IX]
MKLQKTLLAAMTLALFYSCGDKAPQAVDNQIKGDYQQIMNYYNSQRVECEDKSDCPGYAAKLTYNTTAGNEYSAGVCSGTLYKGKYIITNEHCIPLELNAGDSCEGKIKALFPETDEFDSEQAQCDKVLRILSRSQNIDIAVISLKREVTRGETILLGPNRLTDGSSFKAYTMSPHWYDRHLGTIEKKTCQASMENIFSATSDARNKEISFFGSDCDVISGNSGSGMIDSSGLLVGVVHSRVDMKEFVDSNEGRLATAPLLRYSYAGFGSNIACLDKQASQGCLDSNTNTNEYIEKIKSRLGYAGYDNSDLRYYLDKGFKLSVSYADSTTQDHQRLSSLINSLKSESASAADLIKNSIKK